MTVLLLGVVFLTAGAMKFSSPEPFRAAMRKLLGPPVSGFATRAIPLVELALGTFLLTGFYPRMFTAIAVVMLLVFSAALLRMWRKGVKGCGCFGEASESAPSGLLRNALLIGIAMIFVILPETEPRVWQASFSNIVAQLTVVLGALCAWPLAVAVAKRHDTVFSTGGLPR